MSVTIFESLARKKFGTIRKMLLQNGLKPGTVYPVLAGYRKPWPALRSKLSEALEVSEGEIFSTDGWFKKCS